MNLKQIEEGIDKIVFTEREASMFETPTPESPHIIREINAEHLGDVNGKLIPEIKQFISTKITQLLEELREEDKKYDNLDSRVSNDIRTMTKNDGYNQRNQILNDKINKILNK